ncbi:unnamed protein product [Paramecium octaurelia]|uniref:Rab-GAP TBC domain-containing protein n=1 Tax=Paramecium octaurelia TaxID=43137 RepID=A0A8S1T9Z0_PAROT|nr:unnamed protein product [Paramecium octaurelia]
MANQFIEYTSQEFLQLHSYLLNTNNNTIELEKTFKEIERACTTFSTSLKKIAERLHEFVSKGTGDDDNIECVYQYLSNFLLQNSQQWQQTSENLRSEVLEPYQLIMSNYRNINLKLSSEMKEYIGNIQSLNKQISDQQEEYIRLMQNADKSQLLMERTVGEIAKGNKGKDELVRASERQIKLKEIAIEAQEDYKKIIEKGNKKLSDFDGKIKDWYQQVFLNDENRIKFSKQIMLSLMKKLTNETVYSIYQDKLNQLELRVIQKQPLDLQHQIQRLLKKSGTETVYFSLFDQINYDQIKRGEQKKNMQYVGSEWTLIGEQLTEEQATKILQFINDLMENQETSDDSANNSRNRSYSTSSTKSNQFLSHEYLGVKQLMSKQSARQFLNNLLQKEIEKRKIKQLNLSEDSFNEVSSIFKHVFLILDAEFDVEEFYNFLQLSYRIIKGDNSHLISSFSKLDIWQNKLKWKSLYEHIKSTKFQQKQILDQQFNIVKKGYGLISKGLKKITGVVQGQQYSEKEKYQQQKYSVLHEIATFLSELNVSPQLGTDVILELAFHSDIKLEKVQLEKLLQILEEKNAITFNQKYSSGFGIKQRKEDKYKRHGLYNPQLKLIYSIRLSIKYLSYKDRPYQLLLVSKAFKFHLRFAIEKYYIIHNSLPYMEQNQYYRAQNLKVYLRTDQNHMDYALKKSEAQQEIQQYEEIIAMDVQRSLQLHFERVPSSKLQSFLRTYAFHNKEVGYCQGMNYIVGYLYLTFEDEEVTYIVFDYIMRNYFSQYFENEFEMLKKVFYQYERLLFLFLPNLYHHFKKQKVDASYYLTAWFITVFTQVYQFTLQSALLNIIWDIFIIQQWKGFYKCVLFLLYFYQKELLQLEFDQILHFLSEIIKNELFSLKTEQQVQEYICTKLKIPSKGLKRIITNQFHVTNSLLQQLEQEFNCFSTNFDSQLKQFKYK